MKFKTVIYVRSKSKPVEFECTETYEAFGTLSFVLTGTPTRITRVPMSEVLWVTQTEIHE